MSRNRTRAERAALKRRALERVTETGGDQKPVPTETTDEQQGVRGLLEDPHRIRSDLEMLTRYMGCAQFTEEEVGALIRRVGAIVARTERDDHRIAAFRTLLAMAKLNFDIDRSFQNPSQPVVHHQHGHVHFDVNRIGSDLAEVAAEIGLSINLEEDGGKARAEDVIEGRATRS